MKARSASREIALLTLFQHEQGPTKPSAETVSTETDTPKPATTRQVTLPENVSMEELVLAAVRFLVDTARSQVESAAQDLRATAEAILELEAIHPSNLNTPVDALPKPVPIAHTREMAEKIETCLEAAEQVWDALRLPELLAFASIEDTRRYAIQLVNLVVRHQQEIDERIVQANTDWRLDRLIKMDRCLLRMAIAEMMYVDEVDHSVSIDETIRLAKQYSDEDNYKFINGLLAEVSRHLTVQPVVATQV